MAVWVAGSGAIRTAPSAAKACLGTHSVFSDGHVWPSIRVSEALRDGLDALVAPKTPMRMQHLVELKIGG